MTVWERAGLIEATCRCSWIGKVRVWIAEDGTNYGSREPEWPRYYEYSKVLCEPAGKTVALSTCRSSAPRREDLVLIQTCSACWTGLSDAQLAARAFALKCREDLADRAVT